MAMTPEGRVKKGVRELLDGYKGLYQYWPVPIGYGRTTIDVLGCFRGFFFGIECKADLKVPTQAQRITLGEIREAQGMIFAIREEGAAHLAPLKSWLDRIDRERPYDPHLAPAPSSRTPI
jgi:hypothetical protein